MRPGGERSAEKKPARRSRRRAGLFVLGGVGARVDAPFRCRAEQAAAFLPHPRRTGRGFLALGCAKRAAAMSISRRTGREFGTPTPLSPWPHASLHGKHLLPRSVWLAASPGRLHSAPRSPPCPALPPPSLSSRDGGLIARMMPTPEMHAGNPRRFRGGAKQPLACWKWRVRTVRSGINAWATGKPGCGARAA